MDTQLESILAPHNLRVTRPRRLVYDFFRDSDKPVTLTMVHKRLTDVERTSLYRTIQLFLRLNVLIEIPFGWKKQYELAAPYAAHHHHLSCERCHRVIAIDSDKIEVLVEQISRENGFSARQHHFEMKGVCEQCQESANIDL